MWVKACGKPPSGFLFTFTSPEMFDLQGDCFRPNDPNHMMVKFLRQCGFKHPRNGQQHGVMKGVFLYNSGLDSFGTMNW